MSFASVDSIVAKAMVAWKPPPKLSLSEWAEENFYLSAESSAEPGRWKTIPYQRGIMDAFTDPSVEKISVMKSARVGYTKIIDAAIGYFIHQAPCPILVVQPTVDDAKGYSKEEIAPMIRDCPSLSAIIFDDEEDEGPKGSGNTILHKRFPGGVLSMVGANSGAGFRRVSRKVVIFDEVDAYPPSAGSDGDQIKLGTKRSEYYWDRKIAAGSTPLVEGRSRIEDLFNAGDQRRFYVPCPRCRHMDVLVWSKRDSGGHWMGWEDGDPSTAHFICSKGGCRIEHKHKRWMVENGEWRGAKPFSGHASFHIWAAYSYSPNASWEQLVEEWLDAQGNTEKLKTFVNTVLGESWKERGEAPEWERLYHRSGGYEEGTVPDGVKFLTAGVDVQKDRFVYEVVGWGAGRQSWSIEADVIMANTSNEADWSKLDELLNKTWLTSKEAAMSIRCLAVDSGFNANQVYNWGRRHSAQRVIAIKGRASARSIISKPSPVDVTFQGKQIARGYRVWVVGVDVAKEELYGWLKLPVPTDEELKNGATYSGGFCHFPRHSDEYFRQLTAEQLVSVVNKRTGMTIHEWQKIPGRENHWLDARVYARAAASRMGLDRMRLGPSVTPPKPAVTSAAPPLAPPALPPVVAPAAKPAKPPKRRQISDFWGKRGKGLW